jgi:predicted O-methyltransferase YrrM
MTQRDSPAEDVKLWSAVDRYYETLLGTSDPALESALEECRREGLPDIQVSPLQGRFLYIIARALQARRILEIGTLGGYSAIWLARALPRDGRLVTLEVNPKHAAVARKNLARAGVENLVQVRVGPALETLPELWAAKEGPFDLVFIDADKPSYPDYLSWAVRLSRKGGMIVADNVVRRGDVIDPANTDPNVRGVRAMNEDLPRYPHLRSTVLQTVGRKGYDGMTIIAVE